MRSSVGVLATSTSRGALTLSQAGMPIVLVLLSLVFYVDNSAFLSAANVRAILIAVSYVGIIAVGQTLLLVGGEFDISVGANAGLSSLLSGWLMTTHHLPVAVAVLGGLACGAFIGLINGLLVVRVGLPAFIATLGMFYAAGGMTQLLTHGYPIYPLPKIVGKIGAANVFWGLGWSIVVLIVLAVVADQALRRTAIGRHLYATGADKEVARLVGINTSAYKISCFILTGTLSALAGLLVMASLASATTSIGQGWELYVIAGCIVGGVSLFGGEGTIVAGIVGTLLIQAIESGLVVIGVNPNWQEVAVGVVMVSAVVLDLLRRKLSARGLVARAEAQQLHGEGGPSAHERVPAKQAVSDQGEAS
jgi:ribose transport system permease protein